MHLKCETQTFYNQFQSFIFEYTYQFDYSQTYKVDCDTNVRDIYDVCEAIPTILDIYCCCVALLITLGLLARYSVILNISLVYLVSLRADCLP